MKSNFFTKTLMILAISMSFMACGSKKEEKKIEQPVAKAVVDGSTTQQVQTLNFVGDYDLTVKLSTDDNWQTATLTDNSDKTYELKSEPAADGVYLANADGVSIHMKNGEAVLTLVKGKPLYLKEVPAK